MKIVFSAKIDDFSLPLISQLHNLGAYLSSELLLEAIDIELDKPKPFYALKLLKLLCEVNGYLLTAEQQNKFMFAFAIKPFPRTCDVLKYLYQLGGRLKTLISLMKP